MADGLRTRGLHHKTYQKGSGRLGVLILVGALLLAVLPQVGAQAAATPAFVQVSAKEVKSGTTNSLAFPSANTAGNLIVVYVLWSNTNSVTVSDSQGNSYASAASRTTWSTNWSAQVFYASNVAAGANTVTATHATAVSSFSVIYIHEYSGIDKVNPVDVTGRRSGPARHEQRFGDHDQCHGSAVRGCWIEQVGHRQRHRIHAPGRRVWQPHDGPERHRHRILYATARRTATPGSCSSSPSKPTAVRATPRPRRSR